ncbi:MAG: DUF475 domain-containing protein [Rickettsiales bacterium]|nr:DUF475 domain-containing protein [Rickettsiales bacterium]
MRYFSVSIVISIIGLVAAYWWGGWAGLTIAALLSLMEVTLSFDNAVVNAAILKDMDEKWQKHFLTWGILIAVFGMRLVFPLAIVAFATGLSMLEVGHMALEDSTTYSQYVMDSHVSIASFGGMFLLMVFMHYFFNEHKELHWINVVESRLAKLGKVESAEIIVALALLLGMQWMVPEDDRLEAIIAGVVGVVLFVLVNSMTALLSGGSTPQSASKGVAYAGFMGFMYLQILDASFSLDGVIGALAMSKDIVIIMLGLGIGAFFVRSMTVYMVRKGTLDEFVYLEHGAHYGIGALAFIMLLSMALHVSEVVTGLIGASFIGFALISSIRYNHKHRPKR